MKKIVLVAINLTHNREFEKKSFHDQLLVLALSTVHAYNKAKRLHPDAYIIAAWREYGVSNQLAVSQDNIHDFKELLSIVTENRDLLIIAGSLTSQKIVMVNNNQEKIREIQAAYDKYQFIKDIEYKNINSDLFVNYKAQFNQASLQAKFSIIKNTCYFFKQGAKVYRRSKIAPHEETIINMLRPWAYTFKEQEFLFTLDADNEITIGIEICFEHSIGVLKHLIKNEGLKAPTIHIIIADTNTMVPEHACGNYTVRIDSDPDDAISFGKNLAAQDNFFYVYQFDPYQTKNQMLKLIKPDNYNVFDSSSTPSLTSLSP
ncbi:Uncharacterised protein [Legionella busanensis]|uniref:Carbon-nitrogen hydrolase n=1 Tax=Legionella busanensis TaxID=190655 RepID=A0A378JL04_9GAMM|nr:hypothetical protein [Legionella busanensis]STX51421.1 Uncharacterised protein [Legionella busanensis]